MQARALHGLPKHELVRGLTPIVCLKQWVRC